MMAVSWPAVPPLQVIIAGCGRVGAQLARELDADGHRVVIIDKDERAFRRLPRSYGGRTLVGIVFDRDTLLEAGVEDADAFVAVTSGDNSNIVSARIARERFSVSTVVARIYDPDRAVIYERHGITTIATARWTADAVLAHLQPAATRVDASIGPGEGDVLLLTHDLPADLPPTEVDELAREGEWGVVAVTRTGQTTVALPLELVQGGERVHMVVQRSALEDAEAFLQELGR